MSEIFKWNTERLYTAEGQRIMAEVCADGTVFFHDFDRGIYGKLQRQIPERWAFWSEQMRIEWIHNEYLYMRYDWAHEPGMWKCEGEFPKVRM